MDMIRHDKDVWLSDDGTPLYKIHRFTDHFICDFDCSDDKLCSEYIYIKIWRTKQN